MGFSGPETSTPKANAGASTTFGAGIVSASRRASSKLLAKGPMARRSSPTSTLLSARTSPRQFGTVLSHDATAHGTRLLKALLPGRRFPFPKSLYAVEDVLRFFVADKAGRNHSRLLRGLWHNGARCDATQQTGRRTAALDHGHKQRGLRRASRAALRKQRLRPGDPRRGSATASASCITKPRITAAVTGSTPDGDPIKGDYKFTDEFPMADGLRGERRVLHAHLRGAAPRREPS